MRVHMTEAAAYEMVLHVYLTREAEQRRQDIIGSTVTARCMRAPLPSPVVDCARSPVV